MNKELREKLGAYLLDISKLIFGGVVLASIMNISTHKLLIAILGTLSSAIFALAGFLLILYSKRKKQ